MSYLARTAATALTRPRNASALTQAQGLRYMHVDNVVGAVRSGHFQWRWTLTSPCTVPEHAFQVQQEGLLWIEVDRVSSLWLRGSLRRRLLSNVRTRIILRMSAVLCYLQNINRRVKKGGAA